MRRLALLAPALLFLLPVACEDSSGSSSGGIFAPDAGPGFEAGPPGEVDGAAADTSTSLGVTVTVVDMVGPKRDVRVIFHDAAGLVTGQAVTDAAGKVTVASAPSMVTVLTKDASQSPAALTYAGVTDGDNLKVAVSSFPSAPAGRYDVSFSAADPLIANASSFLIQAGTNCYGGGNNPAGTVSVALFSDCIGAKNLVLATASNPGLIVGFSFLKDVAAPVAAATVPVALPAFTAAGATTVKAMNVPAGEGVEASAELLAIVSGQAVSMSNAGGTLAGEGVVFPTATGFADAYQSTAKVTVNSATRSERTLVRREATAASASALLATFDFATALPSVSVVTTQAAPARPDVTFTIADPVAMAKADGSIVKFTWYDAAADAPASWTFVLPPNTTSFKVPALPADATEYAPTVEEFSVQHATFFDSSQLPGYDAAKLLPVAPAFGLDFVESVRLLPAAGTLRVSSFSTNDG